MTTQLLNTLFRVAVSKRLIVCFLFVLFGHSLVANAISPTPQQIEMFKQMPAAERNRLAKQFGVDLGGLSGGVVSAPVKVPETVKPRIPAFAEDAGIQENGIQEKAISQTDAGEKKEEKVVKALKQYGYDLFAGTPSTFAPATDIPVSSDFVVGPGDSVIVQLYGKDNASHELSVNRDGVIAFPQLGPMHVSGMMFSELKAHVKNSVAQQMIGVKATVTMGALRSIRIFVLGEAYRPGSYTVSALSTITNALFSSGGITKVGSLRNIQLKRKGELVGEFDLYDLLLNGDTSKDQRLLPGDVIFIPPIGQTVGVAGEVKRPAIYELKTRAIGNTVNDLIQLAGGFLPTAYPSVSRIDRIGVKGIRTVVDVNLTKVHGKNSKVRDADVIQVFSVLDTVENTVVLKGHVKRPGGFAWKNGLRVSDLLPSMQSLLPNPDLNYALIKREKQPNRDIEIIKVDLGRAIQSPLSSANPLLKPRDILWVFDVGDMRSEVVGTINNQLKFQVKAREYANTAIVKGNVYIPGEYPIYKGMTIEGLLQAARSFRPETDMNKAVLVRKESITGKTSVEYISLAQDSLEKAVLPKDELILFNLNENRAETLAHVVDGLRQQADSKEDLKVVSVSGYVKSPGTYPLTHQMSVKELIALAGGFKEQAFGLAAEITRLDTDENQYQTFERLALDLTTEDGGAMTQLASRDQLYIKQIPNWNEKETVSIKGEVNFPGVYPIYKGDTISDLVSRAGGLNEYAEPYAAIFLREGLRKREQEQLQRFRRQLERDVAELKLETSQGVNEKKESEAMGDTLLFQLVDAKATGRLVIDLPGLLENKAVVGGATVFNIELKNNDQLIIPPKNPEVSVLGEIQFPTSHIYNKNSDVFDYIDISGGFSSRADDGRIYVIRANGQVAAVKNGWFVKRNTNVGPGDTVIVPYDVYSASPMVYWSSVSQILFQLATTVAALNTVGVF